MKIDKLLYSIAMLFLLTAASFGQQVKTDYDRSANFGQYKTYSWQDVNTKDPLWVDRIKNDVDAALTAKGWRQVPSGGNISLVATEITTTQPTLNTYYDNFGGGFGRRFRGGGFGTSTTTVDNYKVGTLVLDMVDSQTQKMVWRGSASDALSNKSDKNIKNLDKGVQKMLKNFPPGEPKK
ncbi:MAG: putative lipoprotein [Acidobacteriaceae bacterium]|nr:putative lipoprotein [Acidobacteriaceae bacterium]